MEDDEKARACRYIALDNLSIIQWWQGRVDRMPCLYTSTVLLLDVSSTADDVAEQESWRQSYPFGQYINTPHVHF